MSHLITNQSSGSEFLMSFNTSPARLSSAPFPTLSEYPDLSSPFSQAHPTSHASLNRLWLMMLRRGRPLIKRSLPCEGTPWPIWFLASKFDSLLIIRRLCWTGSDNVFLLWPQGTPQPLTSSPICIGQTNLHTTRTALVYKQRVILD